MHLQALLGTMGNMLTFGFFLDLCFFSYIPFWFHFYLTVAQNQEPVDWTFAQLELLEKQGIDLRKDMEQR